MRKVRPTGHGRFAPAEMEDNWIDVQRTALKSIKKVIQSHRRKR